MTAEQRQPVEDPPRLVAGDWFYLKNRGWVATFAAHAHPVDDPKAWLGRHVVIDGVEYVIRGVERDAIIRDDFRARPVGLLVKPATDRAVDGADTEETP